MPAPRRLQVAILTMLCAAALGAACALPAAAARSKGSHGHAACATSAAHAAHAKRRHNAAARSCRAGARVKGLTKGRTPKLRPAKQHKLKPRAATPPAASTPASEPASAAPQSATDRIAATIAAVLATPCQNTELTPEAGDVGLVRAAVLCLINRKRAEAGESPLVANVQLEQAADGHSEELVAQDYFAHVSPSGETPVDRIRGTGYIPNAEVGYVIGENLAWGTYQLSTPQAIVAAWIASPGHLANILESKYRDTGIGITAAVPPSLAPGAPGATYAQEFGVIVK